MENPRRREVPDRLGRLEEIIARMDALGADAEDAAARITNAVRDNLAPTQHSQHQQLLTAIGDVIEIVTERSKLSHEAHRLITQLRGRGPISSGGSDQITHAPR